MKNLAISAALAITLLSGCAGAPAASTVTVTATTTVTAPPATPSPGQLPTRVKISSNYGADLASAARLVPESLPVYTAFMKEQLCESPLTKDPVFEYSQFSGNVRTLYAGEADIVTAIRLTVAHFCPQRADLAEEALRYHGKIR